MERTVVTVQFIFIKVFMEEMIVFWRVHICSLIREYIQRRSHVNVSTMRTFISAPLSTLTNLFTQERCPIDAAYVRKP